MNLNLAPINELGTMYLPGHLGIVMVALTQGEARAEMAVRPALMAPNGFLHAGSIVALADTCAGYGCMASLPEGAHSFTTIELKSNHVSTVREGIVECTARPTHSGKTTQVWDALVSHRESGQTLAMFRCTQMILYPKPKNTLDHSLSPKNPG